MSLGLTPQEIVEKDSGRTLPSHPSWPRVELKEVAKVQNGFAFPSSGFNPSEGMPLIRIRDVKRGRTDTRFEGEFPPEYIVPPGSVIIGMDGDFNCAIWPGPPALLNQRVCRIIPKDERVSEKYLAYILPAYLKAINEHTSSITVKHLSSRTVEQIPLPLPCPEEQRQIVDEIETQFARLDDAVAALQRARTRLRRYRASVLKAACEGRLGPTEAELARQEGRDYEPASVLLDRIKAEREASANGKRRKSRKSPQLDTSTLPELPEGWVWSNLDELKAFSLYGPRFAKDDYTSDGQAVLRTSDISESGKVNLTTAPRLNLSDEEFEKYKLVQGDLLITRTGSLGTLAVFNDSVDAIPGAYLIQYRLRAPEITSWYIYYFLSTPHGQSRLVTGGAGVGRPNLNAPTIESIPVPVPPLAEQGRIIEEIERRLSVIDQLEATVDTNLKRTEALRQSILRKAFRGELASTKQLAEVV